MTTMKRFARVFITLISLAVAACQTETLSVTPAMLSFTGAEGTKVLTITSSGAWELTMDGAADWCSVSNMSGRASMAVNVNVTENTSAPRTTQFVVSSIGCEPVTVTVTQAVKTAADEAVPEVTPDPTSGITVDPEYPDADQPCTIVFKPQPGNPLYGHSGELYGHFGVVVDEEWQFVPTEWGTTEEKTHFTKISENHWEFKMEPSIREYFGTGTTPVTKIALIVRDAEGNIKSHDADQFCSVKDTKYQAEQFNPDPVVDEAVPEGLAHGMNINAGDNSVTFVFYDRDSAGKMHDYCYIVGDWNNWERVSEGAMFRDNSAGCWWITLDGFDPDKEYRFQYRLGSGSSSIYVSDPYTEIVYDQWNDQYIQGVPAFPEGAKQLISAFQINKPEFAWKHKDFKVEDKNDLVIYEMLFRDFTTSQNIAGAMACLDHISDLGVNAVQVMPIQEFDGNQSWGYNPNHWFALDKYYGTREQYKEFIDECHARGMAVIVDVVYNHATGSHPWAKLWWNSSSNSTAENNPWFNVTAKHEFNVFHDMNHENDMVKEHVKRSLEYLLTEYDVDGFRFDLTKGFTQNNTLGDVGAWGRYDQSRVDILKGYADHIWSVNSDAVVIFEHLADWSEEKVLAEHGIQLWRNMNGSYRSAVGGGSGDFSGSYEKTAGLYGGWVSYMESHDEERICYGAGADASTVTWGICGTLTSWGSSPDIALKADGAFFSAKNVSFKADDMFKIRGNGDWNDAFNYGASSKGYKLPLNQEYKLTLGSGSQDMAVPAAGTYDIYFSLGAEKVWLMEPGKRPADPSENPGTGGAAEDPLTVAMRRAGASAAFFLTVPGPKMIWQFGEIGYDYSIEYNDRTGEKPVVTEQYMAVPARKALYDTYAALIKFRRDNPRFFDSDASFSWTPTGNLKKITCTADGKTFHVVGNFAKNQVSYTLPSGSWADQINGGTVSGTITLKEGEFRLLTK